MREQSISLGGCQPLEFLTYLRKGFRSLHKGNIDAVCQRAAKLPAVKYGVLRKKSDITAEVYASVFGLGSSLSRFNSFSKLDKRQLCSPETYSLHITCIERSNVC